MTEATTDKPLGITQREAAKRLDVSAPRVSKLVKEGRIARFSDGSVDPESVEACGAVLDARKTAAQGRASLTPCDLNEPPADRADLSHAEALRRKEAALARLRTLEAEKAAGELLAREDVDAAVAGAFARVRARLLAIPSKAAPLLIDLDLAGAEAVLSREVRDVLAELAATVADDLIGDERPAPGR